MLDEPQKPKRRFTKGLGRLVIKIIILSPFFAALYALEGNKIGLIIVGGFGVPLMLIIYYLLVLTVRPWERGSVNIERGNRDEDGTKTTNALFPGENSS